MERQFTTIKTNNPIANLGKGGETWFLELSYFRFKCVVLNKKIQGIQINKRMAHSKKKIKISQQNFLRKTDDGVSIRQRL